MVGFVRLQSPERALVQEPQDEGTFPFYKGFWMRASSFFLDLVFFGLFGLLVRYLGWTLRYVVAPAQELQPIGGYEYPVESAAALHAMASFFAYFAIFEWLYGATPSKIIYKMRVVKMDGAPCGPIAALIRALMRVVDGFFFGIVAAISMTPPLHQRLGDRIARTVVVAAGDSLITMPRPWTRFVAALVVYLVLSLGMSMLIVWIMTRLTPIYSGGATI